MPQSLQEVQQDIDNALKEYPPKNITPAGTRAILKKTVQYVYDLTLNKLSAFFVVGGSVPALNGTDNVYRTGKTILGRNYTNGTGAALEASSAWVDNLNGVRVSPFMTITSPTDGAASTRYFAICELPAQTGGTYDFAQVEFIGKPWDGTQAVPIELSVYMQNRGGFRFQYNTKGNPANGTGIVAMQQPDGRTVVYIVTDNAFKTVSARISNSTQAVIYDTPVYSGMVPTGTEVFNSTKPTVYRPYAAFRSTLTTFYIGNSDGTFPAPINEAGSAQLTIGANWLAGSSEVSLINANLSGGGFSFWQQTAANAKRMLASLSGLGSLQLTGMLKFPSSLASRKITLYDTNDNDNQFFGFGIAGSTLRYQIASAADAHVFYAGSSAVTSTELMRLTGAGNVGIGISRTPIYRLDVGAGNPADGLLAQVENTTSGGNGAKIRTSLIDVGFWDFGVASGTNAFVIQGWNGAGVSERMRIGGAGRVLVGKTTDNGTDLLQVNGSISGKFVPQGGDAQTSEVADGCWRVVKNTSTGALRLVANDGGQIKSILFQ